MKLPLTKPQVWRKFKKIIVERGFTLVGVTEQFKEDLYWLYLDKFLQSEISVETFTDEFIALYEEEPHNCIDNTPHMNSTSPH